MKKIFTAILVTMYSLSGFAQSQNYKLQTKSMSYKNIVEQTRSELNKKDLSILSNKKALKHFERWAYYWKDRVYANGTFPSENLGYFNAGIIDQNGQLINQNSRFLDNELMWENIGTKEIPDPNGYSNYPQMGRLNCFLRFANATDEALDVLFVGAPTGGIWKSVNNGEDWTPMLDDVAGIGITDIKSPSSTYSSNAIIYVSTGDYDQITALKSIGILKSIDGGATFQSTSLSFTLADQNITSNLIVLDENTVIVGTKNKIYKTTDGGANWEVKFSDPDYVSFYGRFVADENNIYCTNTWGEVLNSNDQGDTWTIIKDGPGNSLNKVALFLSDETLVAIDPIGQLSTFESGTWKIIGTPVPYYNPQDGYNQTLVIENELIISAEVNGLHTIDYGDTWYKSLNGYWGTEADSGSYIHSDFHSMGMLDNDPSTYKYWACNDGGLSYIEFAEDNFEKPMITYKSEKCIVTQSYSVAITPNSADGNMLVGNQDNDGFSREMHEGSMQWIAASAGDGTATAINYNNPSIRYLGGVEGGLTIVQNGFSGKYDGDLYIEVPNAEFVWPLEMNTIDPSKLYAGGDDVYLIDTESEEEDPFIPMYANTGVVTYISTHNSAIFAIGSDAIKKSLDGGKNWSSVNQASSDQSAVINSIDFWGTDPDFVYATCASYIEGDKVFSSADGGATWTNISDGLPNILMKEILVAQNGDQEVLYLATELGVYYKIEGSSWEKLGGNSLPNVIVNDIDINYTENMLVAATYGRGLWQVDISTQIVNVNQLANTVKPNVFPNPASNTLQVTFAEHSTSIKYIIYNVVGGVIQQGNLSGINNSINIEKIPNGVYMLKLSDNIDYKYTQKIIKN